MHANLGTHRLRQGSNLLFEQILRLFPHASIRSVLQLQKTRQQRLAEHLRALPGKKRREMVNADNAHGLTNGCSWQRDRYCGLVKGGRDIVHRNRVIGVRTGSELRGKS